MVRSLVAHGRIAHGMCITVITRVRSAPERSLAMTSIRLGPSCSDTGSEVLNCPEASMAAIWPLTLTVASGEERPLTVIP